MKVGADSTELWGIG